MTRDEFGILVKSMKAIYTQPSFIPDKDAFNVWYELLKNIDYKLLSFGLKKYMMTERREPTPSDLISCSQSLLLDSKELNETEAWNLVSKAIRNSTYNSEEEFSKLPETVRRAVSSPGQLWEWATSENTDGKWLSVIQSNFQRSYRAEAQKARERRKLSPDLLRIIDSVKIGGDSKCQIEKAGES